ncbi:MAG: SPOR domain-containing protein [Rhodothermales bacterium]|nr:SPOR domain-containing protein [Rhodothermales bacterium]MBO6780082.1 SPOR domain-containing protein [Rhodothermales bacterium]
MRIPLLLIALVLAGCGGSAAVVETVDLPDDPGPVVHADYETFDIEQYRDRPVAIDTEVQHDVPESLMQNRADAGVEREVSGYRVQVMATLDPSEAQRMEARVRNWWERRAPTLAPGSLLPEEMNVYRLFRQPYYRIRIGDLTTREAAEELLAMVAASFDGAFIVPDRVTVRQ